MFANENHFTREFVLQRYFPLISLGNKFLVKNSLERWFSWQKYLITRQSIKIDI